jgi:hypothetical protein
MVINLAKIPLGKAVLGVRLSGIDFSGGRGPKGPDFNDDFNNDFFVEASEELVTD